MNFDNHTYPYFLYELENNQETKDCSPLSADTQEDFLFLCLSDWALPQSEIIKRVEFYLSQKTNLDSPLKLCIYFWHYSERFNAFDYLSHFLDLFEEKKITLEHIPFSEFKNWSWSNHYRFVDFTQPKETTSLDTHLKSHRVELFSWENE